MLSNALTSTQVMWLCHAETSTGTLQPMNGIGELCHKHDCLLLLDTVTSICGLPVHLEAWGVDAAYAGTQKCMGCPPGVAPLSLGPRALAKLDARKSKVKNWYLDMSMIRKYLESSDGAPRVYHHTAPISMVYAMREALTLVAEEGLENCQARHRSNAEYFWSELERHAPTLPPRFASSLSLVLSIRGAPALSTKMSSDPRASLGTSWLSGGLGWGWDEMGMGRNWGGGYEGK